MWYSETIGKWNRAEETGMGINFCPRKLSRIPDDARDGDVVFDTVRGQRVLQGVCEVGVRPPRTRISSFSSGQRSMARGSLVASRACTQAADCRDGAMAYSWPGNLASEPWQLSTRYNRGLFKPSGLTISPSTTDGSAFYEHRNSWAGTREPALRVADGSSVLSALLA